jgi:hypothetical protein
MIFASQTTNHFPVQFSRPRVPYLVADSAADESIESFVFACVQNRVLVLLLP